MATAEILEKPQVAQISAPQAKASQFSHLPFLDGLRAISILLVLGFHKLGPVTQWIGTQLNGWVGVDLFFIISGFLITSILVKERDKNGSFSLKNFYVRRWLRIAPAYYSFLGVMLLWMIARGQQDFAAFAVAGCYLTNFDICSGWGLVTAGTGLLPTWSLSMEEQFYLLWPGTLKIASTRALKVCALVIAAVYFWRVYLVSIGTVWMRLAAGFDTKLDSIMFGVALALLWHKPLFQNSARRLFSGPALQLTVLIALLVSCHFLGDPAIETDQMLFWSLKLPAVLFLMTALLLSLLAYPSSLLARTLSTKPLVYIGKLSYSLYLWHVVVTFPATNSLIQNVCHHRRYLVEFATYACCFGIAGMSYHFIERPFLKLKEKF